MGKKPRARLRFGNQIKQYMNIAEAQSSKPLAAIKAPLELEVKKPSPGAKPRNPATHPWRYTGQAKGRIFKDIDPVPFDRKVDVPFGVCFNCWQYSHQQSNCPKPTLDDHCQNCGRIGVKVSSCPRCRRAYQVYRKKDKIKQAADATLSSPEKETERSQTKVEEIQEFEMLPTRSSISEDSYLSYDEEFPYDENDDLSEIFVDEDISTVITADFLESFLNLINAMKFLPAQKRADIAQKYLVERRKQAKQGNIEE